MKLEFITTILNIINLCFLVWFCCDNIHLRNENTMLKTTNQQYIEVIKQATEQLKELNHDRVN